MVMDGPPFPCGRTFMYLLEYDGSSRPFQNINFAKSAAVGLTEDWQIKSFAEDRLDHSMVHFQTLHGDGSVDAIPPTDTCHQSILEDILQEVDPIVFEFDAQGGIHPRLLGSIEDFRKIYRRLCDSCLPKDRTCALIDCLKRAEEVATEDMWTKSGRKGWTDIDAFKKWCDNVRSNSSDLYP
jgi:hypothetical protein